MWALNRLIFCCEITLFYKISFSLSGPLKTDIILSWCFAICRVLVSNQKKSSLSQLLLQWWWNTLYSTSNALYPFNGGVDLQEGHFQILLSGTVGAERSEWFMNQFALYECRAHRNGTFHFVESLRRCFRLTHRNGVIAWEWLETGRWGRVLPGFI